MEKLLRQTKRLVPKKLFEKLQPVYHYLIALLGALIYRFPSRKMKVIAVTGTKGKSTVVELINAMLEAAGHKTALQNTIRFKIGQRSVRNFYKMTMPGRFFIQQFLYRAAEARVDYAILEMTSEGARQFRHKFIDLDALVFTNLAPEHIESHGSYEKYLAAKLSLAALLAESPKQNTTIVANIDDKEGGKFLAVAAKRKIGYSLKDARPYELLENGLEFSAAGQKFFSALRGRFNILNILAARAVAEAEGVKDWQIKNALLKLREIPGRVQSLKTNRGFEVIVDYAHTPDSLQALYETFGNKKKICVLGNTGGGRDVWKRKIMAEIADRHCDKIILTDEDPYDEDPEKIVAEMAAAVSDRRKLTVEIDRKMAIRKAVGLAKAGEVVLITGKGTDPYIMGPDGAKAPWDDSAAVKEELERLAGGQIL
jgi:UDP-N-acetylmuramoyl-L-alanyl-D-glutamate--2,6-diaminopimelate ligase